MVAALGDMLEQAARASVARGATYDPGEKIQLDSKDAWQQVAETIMRLIEARGTDVEKPDG